MPGAIGWLLIVDRNVAPKTTHAVGWSASSVGPGERDLKGDRVRFVADQRVSERERGAVGRAAEGHAQVPRSRPAAIDEQRQQAGIADAKAHVLLI